MREYFEAMTKKSTERTPLNKTSVPRFIPAKLEGWGRLTGLLAALFVGVGLFAGVPNSQPLELSDGRVFEAWSVIRQTDDTVTIRHAKGAAKIPKELLPADVLVHYPIIVPPPAVVASTSLPPEPQGLDKPTKGERSISARDTASDTDVRWTCRAAVKGVPGGITRTSKNRVGEFKTDFVLPFTIEEVGPLEDAIAKARKWSQAVAEKKPKPPSFEKSMGQVLGHEWTFSWDTEHVVVHTGLSDVARFEDQDLAKIQVLLAALPHMEKEKRDEAKAGEDFAATLN